MKLKKRSKSPADYDQIYCPVAVPGSWHWILLRILPAAKKVEIWDSFKGKKTGEKDENGEIIEPYYKRVIDLFKKHYLVSIPIFWDYELVDSRVKNFELSKAS